MNTYAQKVLVSLRFHWTLNGEWLSRTDDDVRLEQCGGEREVSVSFLQPARSRLHITSPPIQPFNQDRLEWEIAWQSWWQEGQKAPI